MTNREKLEWNNVGTLSFDDLTRTMTAYAAELLTSGSTLLDVSKMMARSTLLWEQSRPKTDAKAA